MHTTTKHCTSCSETKPILEFTLQGNGPENFSSNYNKAHQYCRSCNAARAREWRVHHPGYRGTGKLTKYPKEDRLLLSAIRTRMHQAKNNSRGKGLPEADLTVDHLYNLFKKQDGKCALSGISMQVQKQHLATLSMDKIIPEKGYTQGNIQWVAWALNRAKGELTMDDFVAMCEHVVEYQKEQRLSKGAVRRTE